LVRSLTSYCHTLFFSHGGKTEDGVP
jgi:hypothetical protein